MEKVFTEQANIMVNSLGRTRAKFVLLAIIEDNVNDREKFAGLNENDKKDNILKAVYILNEILSNE